MNSTRPSNHTIAPAEGTKTKGQLIFGEGEMADLIRENGWASTSLGPLESWSETLIGAVNSLLLSPFPFAIFWGPEHILIYNDSYRPFLGPTHPVALGRSGPEVWQDAWHVIGPMVESAYRQGARNDLQNHLIPVDIDGEFQDRFWTYCFYPLFEGGRLAGVANIGFDATPQVSAVRELRNSEEEAIRILQSIGDAVIVTDAETYITRMNPVAEALTGWTRAEATGRRLSEIFHIVNESTREPVESPADKVRRLGTIVGLANHTILIAKDGTETPIDDSGAPVRDQDGEIRGIVLVFRDVTERRAVERDRELQNRKLQEVLDASTDGVAKCDRDWRITFLNATAQKMLAASGPVLGTNHWESFPSSVFEGSPWLKHYYAAMDQGISGEFDHYYPAPLNIWMHITARPTSDGMVTYFRDTTEQHRTAEALRASEERLRLALAAAHGVGIWDWDLSKDLIYSDAGFARTYGVSPEKAPAGIPAQEFTRNIHPEDFPEFQTKIERSIADGSQFAAEYRLIQSDQSVRWVSALGSCSYGEDGTPLRFPGVTFDITDRKRTDAALRESEARYSAIYTTSSAYIGILSPEGRILDCNRASLEFAGNTLQQVVGMEFWNSPWFQFTPGMPEQIREAVKRAAMGESLVTDLPLVRPSGETMIFAFSLSPVLDADGKVSFIVPEGRDITSAKRTETALLQSEKLAVVGRLAASIAHEINNPLESVTNLLYIARRDTSIESIYDNLDLAERELRRVSAIANQTLRFHRQSTRPAAVSCEDLIQSVLSIFQGRLINSGIEVQKIKRANQPVVCFDGEIRQVLNNLIGNAIDAMPAGGHLLVRSREATDWKSGRTGLAITVADTGIGMEPETLRKMFEPFFTTKGIAGTGLGLWVSKEIIDRHSGILRARSSRKSGASGTVFTLFLPHDSPLRSSSHETDAALGVKLSRS
ncbi:hypothetical protein BH10ACI4_BH10ACI4_10180 [soil metagenome]